MHLFVTFDRVSGVYSNFLSAVNVDDAKRIYANSLAKHPFVCDLSIFDLGVEVDTVSGAISSSFNHPQFVCDVVSLLEVSDNG